jgi:hypothetical protein
MALTKRKDIIDQLIYSMGQVRIANGASADLVTVERHRDVEAEPFEDDQVPALNVLDGNCPVTHQVSYDEHALDVKLQLYTTSRITAAQIDELMGDLLARIALDPTWGGHADGTAVESHRIDLSQDGDTINSATIDIVINYTTDPGKA